MEVRPGYKETKVGVIPTEWDVRRLLDVAQVRSGIAKNESVTVADAVRVHYLRVANVQDGFLDLSEMSTLLISRENLQRFAVLPGDVLMNEGGDRDQLGRCAVWQGEFHPCVHQNHVFVVRPGPWLDSSYLKIWSSSAPARRYFLVAAKQTTNLASISKTSLSHLPVALPTGTEQRAIAQAIGDVDGLLEWLDRLIAKKRDLKQAVLHQLLMGHSRLPGFRGDWTIHQIGELAVPRFETNVDGRMLPVLACSKHLGFVDSLSFFKNQVFSDDLTTYRIIRRGEIGYPANHVEEGSIGLQDRYDAALVSPIYVVFAVTEVASSFFLHRLLKLDSFRKQFRGATAASVDRRGSLRWPAFSELTVRIPSLEEQLAIAAVISDVEAELAALEARREKTRLLKQGMMQELLTGRIRLV